MRINSNLAIVGSGQFALSGPYDCHVYAVRGPEGIVLIDSGSGLHEAQIVDNLHEDFPGEPVVAVIVTHSHIDHAGGAAGLKECFQCRVVTNRVTAPTLRDADEERSGLRHAREAGAYPVDLRMKPCLADTVFSDGDQLRIAGLEFRALHIRGHAEDTFCLLAKLDGHLACFSSDVIFYGGILGVINSGDSGMQGYVADLPKLANQEIEMLLPGHGLFTLRSGQRHIDVALDAIKKGFLPQQIGQGAIIF
ncbi:MAG: MBL fold metallo-hydrolase [Acidobacteria bacterium]|nr:MBL fold metallo-hydrolase [Acidobacteriota bacterium]